MDRAAHIRTAIWTKWQGRKADLRQTPPPPSRHMTMRSSVQAVGERLGYGAQDVLEALLETVADAVYVVDKDGRVAFANPAALELLGYEEHELLGHVSHPTIHHHHWDGTPFPEDECPMLRPRATGETVRVDDDCFWRKDGSKFRVAYSSAPLPQRDGRGAVVVFRDVTARLDAEDAARREAVERARAQEIHDSRARIIAATDAERRRLTRDLHDGAQQRLVRVLFALRLAVDGFDGAAGANAEIEALLGQAAEETESAIVELRELANGIHPAILTNRGLRSAVESLTARLPLLVGVEIDEQRFGPALEAAAYFVIAEGLTNVVKHAGAGEATVHVEPAGDTLLVDVSDDGCGGADPCRGSGLRGLEDRVAALNGTLTLTSPPGAGTRLRIALPLAAAPAASVSGRA
jgi:PAS domain S-box-containing protein